MGRTRIAFAAVMLSGLLAGLAQAGGQASVTILNPPKEAVVGKAFEVAFTVKPEWPMNKHRSLEPTVKAVCGERVITLASVKLKPAYQYQAAVTLPDEGEWVITVDSRFCHTKMAPLVIQASSAKKSRT